MESATHCDRTFTYRELPRHTGTPFAESVWWERTLYAEEGIEAERFTLGSVSVFAHRTIADFSRVQLTVQPRLGAHCQHSRFQAFAILSVRHEHGRIHTWAPKAMVHVYLAEGAIYLFGQLADTCHSAFCRAFGKGRLPGYTRQGQLCHTNAQDGRAWPKRGGSDPVCSGSQHFCGGGRHLEALVSLGCMARAPAARGSPACLSTGDGRCTGNRGKDPRNLSIKRDSSRGEAERVLTAEPGRKAESRAPFQHKTLGQGWPGFLGKDVACCCSLSLGLGKLTLCLIFVNKQDCTAELSSISHLKETPKKALDAGSPLGPDYDNTAGFWSPETLAGILVLTGRAGHCPTVPAWGRSCPFCSSLAQPKDPTCGVKAPEKGASGVIVSEAGSLG